MTTLAGGKAVHYLCDEQADWYPDLDDMASKITDRTRAVVIINPNNPTGAVYPKEIIEGILDLARRHGLMVFADEIYDQILYDDAVHHSAAALAPDLVVLTFCGLSKTYRVAGFRSGWLVVTGPKQHARRLPGGPDDAGLHAAVRRTRPPSTPSRPRSAAGSPSTSSPPRAGGSTNSATWRGRSSTRSPASPA